METINSILKNIHFRLLDTDSSGRVVVSNGRVFDSLNPEFTYRALDLANTQILDTNSPLLNLKFLSIPRMSTLANAYIINKLVGAMPTNQSYVNIGFWCGWSFIAGMIGNDDKVCIGVDNFSDNFSYIINQSETFNECFSFHRTKKSEVYAVDYRDYFKSIHKGSIGVYFYDGDHSASDIRT